VGVRIVNSTAVIFFAMAQRIIEEAKATGHPVALCFLLAQGGYQVALFAGDLTRAEGYVEMLLDLATAHGMTLFLAYGLGAKGMLLTRRGNPVAGAQSLREALEGLSKSRYHLFHTLLLGGQAEALAGQASSRRAWRRSSERSLEPNAPRSVGSARSSFVSKAN
jgi:hypothetical protein